MEHFHQHAVSVALRASMREVVDGKVRISWPRLGLTHSGVGFVGRLAQVGRNGLVLGDDQGGGTVVDDLLYRFQRLARIRSSRYLGALRCRRSAPCWDRSRWGSDQGRGRRDEISMGSRVRFSPHPRHPAQGKAFGDAVERAGGRSGDPRRDLGRCSGPFASSARRAGASAAARRGGDAGWRRRNASRHPPAGPGCASVAGGRGQGADQIHRSAVGGVRNPPGGQPGPAPAQGPASSGQRPCGSATPAAEGGAAQASRSVNTSSTARIGLRARRGPGASSRAWREEARRSTEDALGVSNSNQPHAMAGWGGAPGLAAAIPSRNSRERGGPVCRAAPQASFGAGDARRVQLAVIRGELFLCAADLCRRACRTTRQWQRTYPRPRLRHEMVLPAAARMVAGAVRQLVHCQVTATS